jgi:DNA-binding NarL/FixJ family response regulator
MNEVRRPRVVLADDHRIVAEGLRSLLEEEFELAGIVEDGAGLW